MKKWLAVLILLMLPFAALAEEAFTPLGWEEPASPNVPDPAAYLPDGAGYHDASLDVRVERFRRYDTNITAVYVTIADVSQLRCAPAGRNFRAVGETQVTKISPRVNAVLAVSGDFYQRHAEGIVYRNGVEYRMRPNVNRDTLIIDRAGDLHIITGTTRQKWQAYLDEGGTVLHAFCFGPGLVVDGVPLTDVNHIRLNVGKNNLTQRLAIGQTGPLSYVFVACEGPDQVDSVGLTIQQMADVCAELGLHNAYNLDGGASSTVVLNHEKINTLTAIKIRPVGDCIFFATLVPSPAE